jgi:hypothetical protein
MGIAMEYIFMPYSAFHSDFDVVVMRGEMRCGVGVGREGCES